MIYEDRLDAANAVLDRVLPAVTLEKEHNFLVSRWLWNGKKHRKVWPRKQFIPMWNASFVQTGYDITLLAHLAHWCYGQLVMPLPALRKRDILDALPLDILANAGYPTTADCTICSKLIDDANCEWLDDISRFGPICMECDVDHGRYESVVNKPDEVNEEDEGILSHVEIDPDEPDFIICPADEEKPSFLDEESDD